MCKLLARGLHHSLFFVLWSPHSPHHRHRLRLRPPLPPHRLRRGQKQSSCLRHTSQGDSKRDDVRVGPTPQGLQLSRTLENQRKGYFLTGGGQSITRLCRAQSLVGTAGLTNTREDRPSPCPQQCPSHCPLCQDPPATSQIKVALNLPELTATSAPATSASPRRSSSSSL